MQEDGQLFSPCKCTGSMKYVHTSCLQNWRFILEYFLRTYLSREASVNTLNYWECPTCKYKYNLNRPVIASILQV
jgi:E3 ubiquitin-protein ligase DOA10